ncbi:MAG: serine hydrolase [Acidobacteriota bacterium]|nr:serine hydrolase [Acidobacteriota bacterium]MDQ5839066.1 serine hydrolase [Acidobacteriota bacterium]
MPEPTTRLARRRTARLAVLLLLLFANAPRLLAQTLEERLKEIDEYAARAGQEWKVPGFALAIVKDDRVVFARGYGVRELGKPDPVDKDTLFAIASNTKAFTAAALATLVDEGKLNWDDPVTKYLPWFQLSDPYVTREMTVRDLVSHRSGLATFGGDLLWYETTYPREEIIRRIRYLKPVYGFRAHYGYQNIMFLTAGEIIPAVTGKSWDDYVREKFFAPLGMTRTTTSYRQLLQTPNVATPHNEFEGRVRVIRYISADSAGGAAAINSSVADMAQWIRLQLGRGTFEGKRFFSADRSREMWTPNTIVSGVSEAAEKFNPTVHFNLYGMGWFLSDYRGRKVVTHSGGLDGMTSRVALMPEENLGVVILTNSETPLQSFLWYKVFDEFLGGQQRDWSADYMARAKAAKERADAEAKKVEEARVPNTKPSLPLSSYAGTYTGAMYGDAQVTEENGHLVVRLLPAPDFVGDLEHWHFDTFRIKWRDRVVYPFPRGFVTFTLDAQGRPDQLKIDVPNPDFDFKELELRRAPDKKQ